MPILPNSIGIPKSTRILRTASPGLRKNIQHPRLRRSLRYSGIDGAPSHKAHEMAQSKENQSASHSDEHMLGHGFYNKHSHEQGKANTCALPLIIEAVNQIDLGQIASEFSIADYGSAEGQNSLLPMKTAIAQVKALVTKARRTEIPITVTHTDLPTNDWTMLFQTVLFSLDSYLAHENNVFCFVSGTSIYHQIFPPNHTAFG